MSSKKKARNKKTKLRGIFEYRAIEFTNHFEIDLIKKDAKIDVA